MCSNVDKYYKWHSFIDTTQMMFQGTVALSIGAEFILTPWLSQMPSVRIYGTEIAVVEPET